MNKPHLPHKLLALSIVLCTAAALAGPARLAVEAQPPAKPDTSTTPATPATPEVIAEPIKYTIGDRTFRGMLYHPASLPAGEKRPGVLVFHEWWGANDYSMDRARQLAQLGYVAFAPDMYGDGKLTTDPEQAGKWAGELNKDEAGRASRLAAAVDVLKKRADVDASRLAAVGYCMGGTMALEAARGSDNIVAVACFHTSNLTAKDPAKTVPLKAEVLVCHGDADKNVQQSNLDGFIAAMRAAGRACKLVVHPGAVHAFTNPHADAYGIKGVGYNKAADEESWKQMKALFERTIDRK
ncbi:MAG: dienelactone hydrolase family protein [Phycisphaerales bacterium]